MFLSDISIKRSVLMTMIIFAFVVMGIFSLLGLGIDLFPEIEFPYVTITTIYPGAENGNFYRSGKHEPDLPRIRAGP